MVADVSSTELADWLFQGLDDIELNEIMTKCCIIGDNTKSQPITELDDDVLDAIFAGYPTQDEIDDDETTN